MPSIRSLFVLLITTECARHSFSFVPSMPCATFHYSLSCNDNCSSWRSNSFLEAKASAKKKKKSGLAGGGFGKVPIAPTRNKPEENKVGDYDAFPALEPNVQATLVPSQDNDAEAGELSLEIYDRLAQIYGFQNFNGIGYSMEEEEESGAPMSFDELISFESSSDRGTSSDFGDLIKPSLDSGDDLTDLIASATGAETPTSSFSVQKEEKIAQNLNLCQLPPFSKFRLLHVDPMVIVVDDFFTSDECDTYVNFCANPKKQTSSNDMPIMSRSKTVGKDSLSKSQRTSTTWFHHFKSVPELMAKASRLLGLEGIERWEEPQTVRYRQTEKFTWHLDALAPSKELKELGGQRTATLLVYLTDVGENNGGATIFRDLGSEGEKYLKVQPKKGSALLFFPAAGGIPDVPFDIRTLHAGEALSVDAPEDKWIAQLWLRESSYKATAPPGNLHEDAAESINNFCAL